MTFNFPLIENTYDQTDIDVMIDVLRSDKLTMGKKVEQFEREFSKYIGSNYSIMVNSGSSAKLLAMSVAVNYMRKNKLKNTSIHV